MKLRSAIVAVSVVLGLVAGCGGKLAEEEGTVGETRQALVAKTFDGADIAVDGDRLSSAEVVQQNISERSCAWVEQCVRAPGKRRLLRFDVVTPNVGNADLYMGDPLEGPNKSDYFWSACHRHFHLQNYAKYELLNIDKTPVTIGTDPVVTVVGQKQAFCLLDSLKYFSDAARPPSYYDCGNQGIHAGYADLYNKELDCQWIDITDVPNGDYLLKVTVNVGGVVPDSHPENNTATVPVTIGDKAGAGSGRPRPPR